MSPAARRSWAYLSRVVETPTPALHALVAELGPEGAERAVRDRTGLPPGLRRATQARHHLDLASADLALVGSLDGRLVTPDDDEWPAWRMVGFAPGPRGSEAAQDGPDSTPSDELRQPVRPVALWVRGPARLDEVTGRAVSVVGTRAISGYGEHVTAELGHDLAADGWTVVSGGAYGVDGAAHRAALHAGGPTVAVLAGGIDRLYPRGHSALLERIAALGAVVTEHPPGTEPARHRFLSRNRLVAGLGDGVVVVEAAWRSGARSTATWARALGRPCMAVPGPVTSLASTGCHRLIRSGEAELVTSAAEIAERVGRIGDLAPAPSVAPRPLDGLHPVVAQVYEALPTRGSRSTGQLSEVSGLAVDQVRSALPELELEQLVVAVDGGWVRARRAPGGA